jgi:hypothetical protein
VKNAFLVQDCENLKYGIITTNHLADVYDFAMSGRSQSSYEFAVAGRGNNLCFFSYNIGDTDTVSYCDSSNHIKNCFGCAGLKHKEYCILNKQYSKEEYEILIPKIIEHMNTQPYVDVKGRIYTYGEYFPIDLSRFAYNETAAFELRPISKEEVIKSGFVFKEYGKRSHTASISLKTMPDSIEEISNSLENEVFECDHNSNCNHICTNAFRVTNEELSFYKRMKIALPALCPNCRYFTRMKRTLPYKLWHRKCMNEGCQNEFETSYAPERSERVFCESCYQNEVI